MQGVTVVVPWDKTYPQWLKIALESLPTGIPYVLCPNDSKQEMAAQLNDAFQNKVETEYVFIMGADDSLDPDCLRFLCEAIGTADVAYPTLCDYDIYSQNRIRRTRNDPEQWPRLKAMADEAGLDLDEIAPGDELLNETVQEAEPPAVWGLQDWNFLPGCFLAKTEILRRFPQPELLVEDWAWHFYALMRGARYVPVKDAKYLYRLRDDSLTNRIDKMVEDNFDGDRGPIRRAVRRYVWEDIYTAEDDDPEGRVPIAASFQVSASETQAYVRAVLPARYLPGVVRRSLFEKLNIDRAPTMVLLHPGHEVLKTAMPTLRKQGRRIVVDADDDYLNPQMVPWIRKFGWTELADSWAKNQQPHRQICREADTIICATPVLAYQYEKVNPNVVVIPNTVDEADWADPLRIDDGWIRVGCGLAANHKPDLYLVEDAMRWASEQPGVKVCMIGLDPGWDFDYTHYPYTRSLQHYRDLISILDIALAPLHSCRMNDGKSDLKWLDYTMAGAATIASNQPAFATIRHGDTGLLAKTPRHFLTRLQAALDDPEHTMRMVGAAREQILSERAAWRYREIYLDACGVEPYPLRPIAPAPLLPDGKVVAA